MPIVHIDELNDRRLDAFERLTDTQLRSRVEPSLGVFIAETVEVIGRALDGGAKPVAMLTDERYLPQIHSLLERLWQATPQMPVYTLPGSEVEKITGFKLNRGALCEFRRPTERSAHEILDGAQLVGVLEDIRDFTNIGALFRSAAAMGVDALLVTPACYDPLYRRALRVSMGTVFQVPWARIGSDPNDWATDGLPLLREAGFTIAAMALSDDAISIKDPTLKACNRLALVFGSEGPGLHARTIEQCDYVVKIPMQHGVDSLNVAASSAVAFWELVRDR